MKAAGHLRSENRYKDKGRAEQEWQCSTIQFDFNEPERFDMTYIAPNGEKKGHT